MGPGVIGVKKLHFQVPVTYQRESRIDATTSRYGTDHSHQSSNKSSPTSGHTLPHSAPNARYWRLTFAINSPETAINVPVRTVWRASSLPTFFNGCLHSCRLRAYYNEYRGTRPSTLIILRKLLHQGLPSGQGLKKSWSIARMYTARDSRRIA